MKKELLDFIDQCELSPFNPTKTSVRSAGQSIFKTKDAKSTHTKTITKISQDFVFPDTANILQAFPFTNNPEEILQRQTYFRQLPQNLQNAFLSRLIKPNGKWRPKYDIVVVTEDEKTFIELKNMGCPTKILLTETDVIELEECDIVQVIDCENFQMALERLPQTVFLKSLDQAYLERYVELLSGWTENLTNLSQNPTTQAITELVNEISPLLELVEDTAIKKITRDQVEEALDTIKEEISMKVKEMSVSGDSLIQVLSQGILPQELKTTVTTAIRNTGLPEELFFQQIPVSIDESALEKVIRNQNINEFISIAEKIREKSQELTSLPQKLKQLENLLLLFDFEAGISKWSSTRQDFIQTSNDFLFQNSQNNFLQNPQPISFFLNGENRCSILTGANSGGKTTLLEHTIQLITCHQLGLPVAGPTRLPIFSEIYYFAKTKGSMSKGAFETLLTQMNTISPGPNSIILADEIEAVTEPGVAGEVICATAEFFISKGCFLIVATHLGQEIEKTLPRFARIDGIEAKGLNENNELIIDHNPVLGRLAHSTPELIVEKMALTEGGDYFSHLRKFLNSAASRRGTRKVEQESAESRNNTN